MQEPGPGKIGVCIIVLVGDKALLVPRLRGLVPGWAAEVRTAKRGYAMLPSGPSTSSCWRSFPTILCNYKAALALRPHPVARNAGRCRCRHAAAGLFLLPLVAPRPHGVRTFRKREDPRRPLLGGFRRPAGRRDMQACPVGC